MALRDDWKDIIKYAWSVKLNTLAGALSFAEFMLPYIQEWYDIPRGTFAVGALLTIIGSNIARIISQKELSGEKDGE
jgi:hypothetical protein